MLGRKFVVIIIYLILFAQLALSGTTGKIAGRVTDKETGDPLPGANILVEGTTMGAAADLDGYFTILHVPPGLYTVTAKMIGYASVTVSEVRVRIDQTARVDFELKIEAIAGEAVTIVAERKVVKEDVATSVAAVTGDEVKELPLATVTEVVGLQAGVQEGLEIRGGGADQALFQIDGITLRDPRNNQPITGIALSAIQEVSIERGGFNAEYGQVRSGIVNVVTKEGSKTDYSGSITLRYSPPARKYFGISPYDPNSFWLRPYLDPEVCWTGTQAWDYYTQRQYPAFEGWNAVSERLLSDSNPANDLSPAAAQRLFRWEHRRKEITDQPDYNIDAGFGGPVPLIGKKLGNLRFFTSYRIEREMLLIPLSRDDYLDYNWSLKLTSDISSSMKLMVSGLSGKSYYVTENEPGDLDWNTRYTRSSEAIAQQLSYPRQEARASASTIFSNSYFSTAAVTYGSVSAKLTHMLNPKTFYEASLEHVARRYKTGPVARRNLTKKYEIIKDYLYATESPYGWDPWGEPGIDGMMTGGHTATTRDSTKISSTTLKFDLTSQVNFSNLVKTGIELVYNDLDFNYGEIKPAYPDYNTYVKMRKFPLRGALYLQDKLEAKGFVANLGLRLDYNDPNTYWIAVDPFNRSFYSADFNPNLSYPTKKVKSRFYLSPRLGISHPITVNSKLFFNYGHFKQLPSYEQIFRMSRGGAGELDDIGDPNLVLARTISYELGYDHALFDNYLIQLAGFYHDISDQQTRTIYTSADGSINYNKANNDSYEDIRGFEATIRKTSGTWWVGFANYTYQVSTRGHFGKGRIYQDPSEQRKYDWDTRNLYQERPIPRPYARASLTFYTPAAFGPKTIGIYFLGNWTMTVLADWRAGDWLTWNPNNHPAIAQNVQAKDWYNIRLRLTKTVSFKKWDITFLVDVNNALNTKRLSLNSFYDTNDYLDYFNSLHLPRSNAYNNIVGKDKVGDYRKEGVPFQPIEQVGIITKLTDPEPGVIYYGKLTETDDQLKYYHYVNGTWSEVEKKRMQKILDDKAYINMPNLTTFNFLNPRDIFIGIRTSFNL